MVNRDQVEQQLKRIGCNFRGWGRSEFRELANVLMDKETIAHCVNGHYEGGFALLVATDHRVLLVDKKPMNYLNVEDVRFEMISEFDYGHRMLNATVRICTTTKTMRFTSWNQRGLRALLSYVQQRVIEIREYYSMAHQFHAMAQARQTPQLQQPPTFVPNTAPQGGTSGSGDTSSYDSFRSGVQSTLGAFTTTKLPHFRRRNSRQLGKFAVLPDDIYPAS